MKVSDFPLLKNTKIIQRERDRQTDRQRQRNHEKETGKPKILSMIKRLCFLIDVFSLQIRFFCLPSILTNTYLDHRIYNVMIRRTYSLSTGASHVIMVSKLCLLRLILKLCSYFWPCAKPS